MASHEPVTLLTAQSYATDPVSRTSSPDSSSELCFTTNQTASPALASTVPSSVNSGFCSPHSSVANKHGLSLGAVNAALERELEPSALTRGIDLRIATVPVNPYELWQCAFGFTRELEAPSAIPSRKDDYIQSLNKEITAATHIQGGLASYIKAINSGEYHVFDEEFLINQGTAVDITVGQLSQIVRDLAVLHEQASALEHDDTEVSRGLQVAYAYAQPWVQRARAILVSNHVFYKINYVLGSDKKKYIH